MPDDRRPMTFGLLILQAGLFLVTSIESGVAAAFGLTGSLLSCLLYAGLTIATLVIATGVIRGWRRIHRPALLLQVALLLGGLLTALVKADILSLTTSVLLPAALAWLLSRKVYAPGGA